MLKVEKIQEKVPVSTLNIDEYIPLTIEWHEEVSHLPPLYWRTGNFQTSLLELGIHHSRRTPCSLTLTMIDYIGIKKEPIRIEPIENKGFPSFSYNSAWESDARIDESIPLHICTWDDCVSFLFSNDGSQAKTFIRSNNVIWGIGENQALVGIYVFLDQPQMDNYRRCNRLSPFPSGNLRARSGASSVLTAKRPLRAGAAPLKAPRYGFWR